MDLPELQQHENAYPLKTHAELQKLAEQLNVRIVEPRPDQLQIDIDSLEGRKIFADQWPILTQIFPKAEYCSTPSKSPGHFHITVNLGRYITTIERLGLQAMMGSDRKRELLGFLRKERGLYPVGFFFEPKS